MDKLDGRDAAMLFPHCFMDPDRLKGAIGLFGSLEICLPWEMNPEADMAREEIAPFIKVLRPPEALKPGPGFGRRLAEYREWMRHHQDKSILHFLGSLQGYDSSEEKSWEIRKGMRGERDQAEMAIEDPGLKYHLVLHLAREAEESRHTAESLIDVIKASGSPLSGAIDAEDENPGLFDDLPSREGPSMWQGHQWLQMVEAWLGLFHQHLAERRILLTPDPGLADFLKERFEKTRGEIPDRLFPETMTIRIPEIPSTVPMDEISKTGRRLFPKEVQDRLAAALDGSKNGGENRVDAALKDPVVRGLSGKVLVTLVR
jgi:hypothetical protein